MIIHITQNDQYVYEIAPGTPVHLFAGALGFWQFKTRFVIKNQATGAIVLDTIVGVNAAANAGMDWTVPTVPGTYLFFPDYDSSNDFAIFEVTAAATIPGTGGSYVPDPGGGYTPPITQPPVIQPGTGGSGDTGDGTESKDQLPSWLVPAGIGLVALILLMPSGRK